MSEEQIKNDLDSDIETMKELVEYSDNLTEIIEAIEFGVNKLLNGQKQNNWISVDDRLPEIQPHDYYGKRYSVPVLIYDEYKNPQCVRWDYKSKGWVNSSFNDGCNCWDYPFNEIMLWQPLPGAPA